jgi:hypothetical protein
VFACTHVGVTAITQVWEAQGFIRKACPNLLGTKGFDVFDVVALVA